MSKIKKSCISILITMIVFLVGITNMSNAEYELGQTLTLVYSDYSNNKNMFCVEKGQNFGAEYKVISKISINGTKSTDYKNKTVDDYRNAKLAYILSSADKYPYEIKESSVLQKAVWVFEREWMNSVGVQHYRQTKKDNQTIDILLAEDFIGSHPSYTTDDEQVEELLANANEYANNIKKQNEFKDNTNKQNIKIETYEQEGRKYLIIGDFNWSFKGKLKEIKAYDQDNREINDIKYLVYEGNNPKEVNASEILPEKSFCLAIPTGDNISSIKKIVGVQEIESKKVTIDFLESKWLGLQNLIVANPSNDKQRIEMPFEYDIKLFGNLKVIKVAKENEKIKLANVGFIIQNSDTKKYVKRNADKTVSYVDKYEDAEEMITDQNGEINIDNLIVGNYTAYETKNQNYGYEIIKDGIPVNVVVDKTQVLKIGNSQKYVKLSGYVWVDRVSGKQSNRNNLYYDGEYDKNDVLLDGIKVKLKNRKTNEVVKEVTTASGGAYKFVDVLIEELQNYYIEFEYDGLTYTNVIPTVDKANGSKSIECVAVREEFNKNFSVVNGKTRDTGVTLDSNGNEKHQLSYFIDENNHTATLDKTKTSILISATTDGEEYITKNSSDRLFSIWEQFEYGKEEITNINLGLYEREMPYTAVLKDIESVKMTINGKAHVYQYAQRFLDDNEYKEGFNVGVKFGEKFGNMSYSRPIYKADYEYETEDKSKELKMYITYKIELQNRSGLMTKVNSIVDYYDSKYKSDNIHVGTKVEQGNITEEIGTFKGEKYNDKYNKVQINCNTEITPLSITRIYIQFELDRDAVLNLLNGNENLENVAEINSYSIFNNAGKPYAGIDKKSNPGNTIPGDERTYEDDTDKSPNLKLETTDAREISGKVFLDETTGEIKTGETRKGDGKYTDGEKGISDVKVTLAENTVSGKVYETVTDENGNYTITGFIPGDYTLKYTWGDETYTVQKYKGTIYDISRNQNNVKWYKENIDLRLSDAIDNYNTDQEAPNGSRLQIDAEEAPYTRTKMDSITPKMDIGIEYESTFSDYTADKFVYIIKNIDFGIVERARQRIELDKLIRKFKVSLADGQVIADVTVNDDGTISGQRNHITYMAPTRTNNIGANGFIKLELDNELIQGAQVEVQYDIKVTNSSELDYLSEEYYKYGIVNGDVVTLTPTKIVDYLDKEWAFENKNNPEWEVEDIDTIKTIKKMLKEEDYIDSTISEKTLLNTESLKDVKLEPKQNGLDLDKYSRTLNIDVSKMLANSDEIYLDNEVEVAEVEKNGGLLVDSIPGNYIPGIAPYQEPDDSMAPTVIITPNTGDNLNIVIPIVVSVIALVTLGVGIFYIKKKAL